MCTPHPVPIPPLQTKDYSKGLKIKIVDIVMHGSIPASKNAY